MGKWHAPSDTLLVCYSTLEALFMLILQCYIWRQIHTMDLSVAKICCRSFREILEILDADLAIFNGANPRPSYSMQFLHGIHTETTSIHVQFFSVTWV